MNITLQAHSRILKGKKVKKLRREGLVPAVLAGKNIESRQVTLPLAEFTRIRPHISATTLLDVIVDDEKPLKALLHSVQTEPRTGKTLHVELYGVRMEDTIKVEVPLHVHGVAPVIATSGGTLVVAFDHVEIRAQPDHLVPSFDVDISVLASFDDRIRVADMTIPEGVEILTPADTILVSVLAPRGETEAQADQAEGTDAAADESASAAA